MECPWEAPGRRLSASIRRRPDLFAPYPISLLQNSAYILLVFGYMQQYKQLRRQLAAAIAEAAVWVRLTIPDGSHDHPR
jgi:hypothetical protein